MTETALNEKIDELQENDSRNAHQRQKARRRLRRGTSIRKADRLLRIINYGGYAPHRGYIDWGFTGAGMFPQKATITVGSSIIGGHCIDEVNLNG